MKIELTFKTPDIVHDTAKDLAMQIGFKDEHEMFDIMDDIKKACEPWVKWGEYVTIEIDTETGEAKVQKAK
jgi:lipoate-protein ligase A